MRTVQASKRPTPREANLVGVQERRAPGRRAKASVAGDGTGCVVGGLLGVEGDDMSRRNEQRKRGSTRGSPRRSRTAKASRISRPAAKSRCACEWGGWGHVSEDGPGQNNPDRSEDPWGRAEDRSHGGASTSPSIPTQSGDKTGARGARRVDANRGEQRVCREQA